MGDRRAGSPASPVGQGQEADGADLIPAVKQDAGDPVHPVHHPPVRAEDHREGQVCVQPQPGALHDSADVGAPVLPSNQ
jgi:hypothetical protein